MPTTLRHGNHDHDLDGAILESAVAGIASPSALADAESYFHTHIPQESTEDATESQPLLTPGLEVPTTDAEVDAQFLEDWKEVPKWRRPSVMWLLGPFFVFAVAFGG